MDSETLALFATLGSMILVVFIIGIAFYVVEAIARYKYLRVRGYQNAWMGIIPFANIWATVEATYGNVEKIRVYGWDAPAIVVKLWPVITYGLSALCTRIPYVGGTLSTVVAVLNIAVMVLIFRDTMERLDDPQGVGFGILAVVIGIIGSIKLLSGSGKFLPGSQDYMTDPRVLTSQATEGGPLSFLNGKS